MGIVKGNPSIQKRDSGPLELELQGLGSGLIQVLGTELGLLQG